MTGLQRAAESILNETPAGEDNKWFEKYRDDQNGGEANWHEKYQEGEDYGWQDRVRAEHPLEDEQYPSTPEIVGKVTPWASLEIIKRLPEDVAVGYRGPFAEVDHAVEFGATLSGRMPESTEIEVADSRRGAGYFEGFIGEDHQAGMDLGALPRVSTFEPTDENYVEVVKTTEDSTDYVGFLIKGIRPFDDAPNASNSRIAVVGNKQENYIDLENL